ncbi:MAG: phage/plasmid replication protein, II/X family [Gammaproteobacteria bacterium]|nr:phage/plasmid replication protein, II/X family [Gammaproteobacteria bacterium]
MIDMLVLRCTFKKDASYLAEKNPLKREKISDPWMDFSITNLKIPLAGTLMPDDTFEDLRVPWQSIPTSNSGLSFKVFHSPENKIKPEPYIEIKASPAKLMLGHNVFGSTNLLECSMALFEVLYTTYPELVFHLDEPTWEVAEMHVTFFSRAKSEREAGLFIQALQNVSNGHTKSNGGYATTSYFGKKHSRLKTQTVYAKYPEVLTTLEKLKKNEIKNQHKLAIYDEKLLDFAKCMVRWEAKVKSRWLIRNQYPTNLKMLCKYWTREIAIDIWKESFDKLLKCIGNKEMRIPSDDNVLSLLELNYGVISEKTGKYSNANAIAMYKSYRLIRSEGYAEWSKNTPSSTRSRHLAGLHSVGLSKALLQQHRGHGLASEVVPMIRFIEVDFCAQYPGWYQAA